MDLEYDGYVTRHNQSPCKRFRELRRAANVEQVVYCSILFALLLPYVAVSPLSHSPCHAPYAPDSTIMRYHASI
jgi:hypothetical protein